MHDHDCDCGDSTPSTLLSRRGFLSLSLGGYLGLSMGGLGKVFADSKGAGFGQAKHCIILWLNGAPSQMETWDPKPGTKNGGPTKAIKTSAKGIQIAHTLPRMAEQMHHVALVRSMYTREANHQRGRYFLHTGYVPSGTVKHPDMGSLICQGVADMDAELPPYICINNSAAPGSGTLGVTYSPFTVQDPTKPVENLSYARGVDKARFTRRRELLESLEKGFTKKRPGAESQGHQAIVKKADKMMHSPKIKAFQLAKEPESVRKSYGQNKFGQGCLMARRLIEQGVRVVEVQLNGWDTHRDNFNRTKTLGGQLDAGFAGLLADLKQRDLLKKTLVVCMGEFGRTPRINANEGRDHWARGWSLALAGGPVRGGTVIGATTKDGMRVAEKPKNAQDIMASVVHAMGVDRNHVNYTKNGRPITVVDKPGKRITELFA